MDSVAFITSQIYLLMMSSHIESSVPKISIILVSSFRFHIQSILQSCTFFHNITYTQSNLYITC